MIAMMHTSPKVNPMMMSIEFLEELPESWPDCGLSAFSGEGEEAPFKPGRSLWIGEGEGLSIRGAGVGPRWVSWPGVLLPGDSRTGDAANAPGKGCLKTPGLGLLGLALGFLDG